MAEQRVVVPRYPDDDGFLSGPPNRIGQLRASRHLHEIGGPRFAVYNLEQGRSDGARLLPRTTRLALWAEHLQRDNVPVDFCQGLNMLRDSAADVDLWHDSGCRGPRPNGRLRRHQTEPVGPLRTPLAGLLYRLVNDPDGRPLALRLRGQY